MSLPNSIFERDGILIDTDGEIVDPLTIDEQIEMAVGLAEALDMALVALQDKAEGLSIAPKMVAAWGEKAPKAAKRDVIRRGRLLAAVEMLKEHRRALNPY